MTFRCCGLVPVYNHPDAIGGVVDGVLAAGLPVILVDDGSGPACRDVLVKLAADDPRIHLHHLPQNQGKGSAVKAGLRAAHQLGYSHALQIDADGQHDAGAIPRLLDFGRRHPQAIISGRPEYDHSVPALRYYSRYLTHVWVWINTLSLKIEDSMCGFRVYPVASCCRFLEGRFTGNYMDFDTEVLVKWQWAGGEIHQLPVIVRYPVDGVSHFRGWEDNWLITRMHTRLFFGMLVRLPGLLGRRRRTSSPEKWRARS
ncbi:glycosyltransferase family 2 protein [Marinobacter changyiensis]|uniref:glycosyltransferase family 2 protein n=1 Tax=Marinobacter changyiensis TaxID=2604091 RepID=UPI001264ED7C|nr:glycosyltransferase family 2 protein [Marinobacter changyiensis]